MLHGTALAVRQPHVDERALAVHRAPVAGRVLVRGRRVFQRLDDVVAAEAASLPPSFIASPAQSAAPMAPASPEYGCTTISASGHLAANEVDLRLHHREVAVRAALQDELAARGGEVLELPGVHPHVERQHRRERRP